MKLIAADADNAQNRTMAGVTVTQPHLVVLKKDASWTNREFVVTPKETKFTWAYAQGIEDNRGPGTSITTNDMNQLLNGVESKLNTNYPGTESVWKDGRKPIFCSSWRGRDAQYRRQGYYSFYQRSAVAYKFDLRNIPLKFATSVSAKVRAYVPSCTLYDSSGDQGGRFVEHEYIPLSLATPTGAWMYGRSMLQIGFSKDLPNTTSPVLESGFAFDSFSLSGKCNNGYSEVLRPSREYSPNGIYESASSLYAGLCAANAVYSNAGDVTGTPTEYVSDFNVPNDSNNLRFLKDNTSSFWMIAKFGSGNCFYNETGGLHLWWDSGIDFFIQRLELVLTVSMPQI